MDKNSISDLPENNLEKAQILIRFWNELKGGKPLTYVITSKSNLYWGIALIFIAGVITGLTIQDPLSGPKYDNPEECILDNVPGAPTQNAVNVIRSSCIKLYRTDK